MKGGGLFYGLRMRQLSLFFIGVVCTTIVVWTWEKNPLLTTLLPPQDQASEIFPAEEVKVREIIPLHDDSREAERSVDLVPPLGSTHTGSSNRGEDEYSSTTEEKNHENTSRVVEKSISKESSEGDDGSKRPRKQQLVTPATLEGTESSVRVPVTSEKTDLTERGPRTNVEKQACNFGKGRWVADDGWPLYSGFLCKQWLSEMWACRLTQRTDFGYEKLKWQPKDCKLDEFTGLEFLKRMQDKTLAFVGDSLGRQQFQSLMCMITGGEMRLDVQDVGKQYGLVKVHGSVRPDGWAYHFPSTNTTVLYYWSASLCDLEPIDPLNSSTEVAMHLDRPPAFLQRFLDRFHVLVLNTGHHWNRGKLNANRWVIYVEGKPNTNRRIANIGGAKNFTIYSIINWVNSQLPKHPGLKVFLRSLSPRHFFNGDWNTGGTCDSTTPGALEVLEDESSDPIAAEAVKGTDVKLLDITGLSQVREEGHISKYSIKAAPGMQDCLHWCLPGVPDTWNEILFTQI